MLTVDPDRLGLEAGEVVLDLGCGDGRHARALSERDGVYVVGLDLRFANLAAARARMADVAAGRAGLCAGDALMLPFADGAFDAVVCAEVLEHLPEYRRALDEIDRVLKIGGDFAISVPRYGPEQVCWALSRAYHAGEDGHVRIFRARALRREIEGRGMRLGARHWAHALHSPYWWLQCLMWSRRERSRIIRAYHRFLVWDLMKRPTLTRRLETLLNPVLGKSVVLYFRKEARP